MNPRNGASPVPAATQIIGVFSASTGSRNGLLGVRTATLIASPGDSESRYVDATPMCRCPDPDSAGALKTETVNVTSLGFHRGEDEIELPRLSAPCKQAGLG